MTIRVEILTREGLYTYIDQDFEREDFHHSIDKIEMSIKDNFLVKQVDDYKLSWVIKDKDDFFCITLDLEMNLFHIYPSIVFSSNFINMAVTPFTKISGYLVLDGKKYDLAGYGAMDQYWSRKIQSASAKKYGYSHYEPIMWNNELMTVLYYMVDSNGKVILKDLVIPYEEELVEMEALEVKHKAYYNGSSCFNPKIYQVVAAGKDLKIEYKAETIIRKGIKTWGFPESLVKTWSSATGGMPLINAIGTLKRDDGEKRMDLSGKGILEFIVVDPESLNK